MLPRLGVHQDFDRRILGMRACFHCHLLGHVQDNKLVVLGGFFVGKTRFHNQTADYRVSENLDTSFSQFTYFLFKN